MEIKDMLLTPGAARGRTGQKMTPQGVVIHYVANPGSTAANNRNWFENGSSGAGVSAHYIVGLQGEIIRCIPDNETAQHAGKSYGKQWDELAKTNNARFIGIETCHPDASGKFSDVTIASLVWLVRELCAKWKLDPAKDVYRHYDVCGKACPLYYVNNPKEWDKFRESVIALSKPAVIGPWYRVRKTWQDAASQIGAYLELNNAKNLADVSDGYKVFDESGAVVYDPKNKETVSGGDIISRLERIIVFDKTYWDGRLKSNQPLEDVNPEYLRIMLDRLLKAVGA